MTRLEKLRAEMVTASRDKILDTLTAFHCASEKVRPHRKHRRRVKDAYIRFDTPSLRIMVLAILNREADRAKEKGSDTGENQGVDG